MTAPRLLTLLLGTALGLGLAASGLSQPPRPANTSPSSERGEAAAAEGTPIEVLDAQLRQQGWQSDGDAGLDPLDRQLAGNNLSSLRSCSGTGAGFCRYDYRRGSHSLQLITVPGASGRGSVVRWIQEPSGRSASP